MGWYADKFISLLGEAMKLTCAGGHASCGASLLYGGPLLYQVRLQRQSEIGPRRPLARVHCRNQLVACGETSYALR